MFRLEDCLAYLASRHTKELAEILDRKLMAIGITRVQWMALYYIRRSNDVTQKDLGLLLGVREPTVVRLLDRMEKDDLVTRIRKDRRTNSIELTEKGKDLYERGLVISEQFKNDAMTGIPEEHMEIFRQVLDQMIQNTKQ